MNAWKRQQFASADCIELEGGENDRLAPGSAYQIGSRRRETPRYQNHFTQSSTTKFNLLACVDGSPPVKSQDGLRAKDAAPRITRPGLRR